MRNDVLEDIEYSGRGARADERLQKPSLPPVTSDGIPRSSTGAANKDDAGDPGEQLSIHHWPFGLVYVRYAGNPGS